MAHMPKIFLASIFLSVSCALAEPVSYSSVPLVADEVTPVGGEQLKIVVGGESFITSRKDAGKKVAALYLAKPKLSQKLVKPQVTELILEATRLQDRELATSATGFAISSGMFSEQEFRSLVTKLKSIPEGVQVLEQGIIRGGEQAKGRSFCIALQYLDPTRLVSFKDLVPLIVYRHQFECTEYLRSRAQSLLEGGDIEGAQEALETAIAAFNDGSEQFLEIVTVQKKLEKLRTALKDGDVANAAALLNGVFDVPLMRPSKERIYPLIVDALIDNLLVRGETGKALEAVPLMDFNRRTDREDDQIVKVLKEVRTKEQVNLRSSDVRRVLRAFSEKSDFVRDEYLAALSRIATDLIIQGNDVAVPHVLEQMIEVRPDPSFDNDRIRLDWARMLLSRGEAYKADDVLMGVVTGVPLLTQVRMMVATINWLSAVLVLLCGAALFGIMRIKRARVVTKVEAEQGKFKTESRRRRGAPGRLEQEDEEPQPRPFVAFAGGARSERALEQYDRCLATFGLKAGVNLSGIKVAYRNAVKSCHPDLNPNSTAADTERFIELTKVYDELLKLHAERTGER
jgi:hypothetical protein